MEFSNPNNARKINRLRVLNELLESGPLTRAELSRRLVLNKISISEIVASLIAEELVLENGKTAVAKDGGRPGTVLTLNGRKAFVLGIDLGDSVLRLALSDLTGSVFRFESIPYEKEKDLALFIVEQMKRILKNSTRDVSAIAIAADGEADDKNGTIAFAHGAQAEPYPLKEKLKALGVNRPIILLSQLSAQVKAERMHFKQPLSSMLFINWGEYLSSAFITKTGTVENPEFGHITAADKGICHCGSIGCIDTLASGWGFKSTAAEKLGTPLSVKELVKLDKGDSILRDGVYKLGKTVATAVTATGAKAVILGGGISSLPDIYFAVFSQGFQTSLPSHLEKTPVYRGNFKEKGTAQGAVYMALDRIFYSRDLLCSLGYLKY
jgi:Transcriptional regulator/sugar kinase